MKNKFFFFMGTLVMAAAFFGSCSTSIPITVSHPPRMNTDGVERIVVLPFNGPGNQQIAAELSGIFRDKIRGTGKFTVVDPVVYKPSAGMVDAVFTGDITGYTMQDSSRQETRTEKINGQNIKVPYTVYDRTVSLSFRYRLIRDRDGIAIGERNISCTAADTGKESPASLQSGISMAVQAAQGQLRDFTNELVPWTSTEQLTLDKETSKEKTVKARMKEAEKLVKAGSYQAAQDAYAQIYAETGSVAAGYNQAILAQPLDGLQAAISLLGNLASATGYAKASAERTRLMGFLSENERAAASKAGTSGQKLAIDKASKALIASLPAGSRVSLLNVSASEKDLVNVVIREITDSLRATGKITVLDRQNLELVKAEQEYQLSGMVSDDSIVKIGKLLGVETIVTFSIAGSGYQRKLTVNSMSVETGEVLYNESTEI